MEGIIFRDDDISPSSNFRQIDGCHKVLRQLFPGCAIISCITLFSKYNKIGSVYQEIPFKGKPKEWFYDVDKFLLEYEYINRDVIASHGLIHSNHAKLSRDAQEMSILTSCRFLKTNMFVPPFNAHNKHTADICEKNDIKLLNVLHPWKSIEFNNFDANHKYWYFHSWRFTPESLREKFAKDARAIKNNC
jgi:hypothetical protein